MKTAVATAALCLFSYVSANYQVYNESRGFEGLFYSAGAYCSYDTLANWNCGTPCIKNKGLTDVTQIRNTKRDTFAYSGYNEAKNEVIFAFRGTDGADFQNWVTNINAFKTDFPVIPGSAVHTGFFDAYKDIQSQVEDLIVKMLDKYSHLMPSIFVTGHSLGGALAVFAAIDIKVHHRY